MLRFQILLSVSLLSLVLTACGSHDSHDSTPTAPALSEKAICQAHMQEQFAAVRAEEDSFYTSRGSQPPPEPRKSQLLIGDGDHAVILIHGFMSSPEALNEIAQRLHDQGDTVYSVLLRGHGSDAQIANQATVDDWRHSVTQAADVIHLCHPNIEVVSHSLGSAIVTDEIIHQRISGITNLVYLAPYLKLEQPFPAELVQALGSQVEVIDVATLRKYSGGLDPYSYLPITRPKPGEPEMTFPLKAMSRVIDLQTNFAELPKEAIHVPVLLITSEADPVIDSAFARQYLGALFPLLTSTVYLKAEGLGHSLELRAENPHFDDMFTLIQRQLSLP